MSYLVLVLLLCVAGGSQAWADKVYNAVGFGETPLEEITPGKPVALYFTCDKTGFLNSEDFPTLSNIVTEASLFIFEETGEENLYYIKAVKSDKYLYYDSNYDLKLTESRLNATAFLTIHPDYYDSTSQVPTDIDPRFVSVDPNPFPGCGWVLNIDKWSSETQAYYLSCYSGQNYGASSYEGYTGKYYYYNTWLIYDVEEIGGYEKLQELFLKYFPDGTLNTYKAGKAPGCIPQDVYNELKAAFEEAENLVNTMSTDVAACNAAADRLQAAVKAAEAAVIKLDNGYYIITNYASPHKAMRVNDAGDKVIFNTEDLLLNFDHELTLDDMPYIWKLTAKAEGSNSFYVQNVWTGTYMGEADYYKTPTTTEATSTWDITASKHFQDAFTLVLTGAGYGASSRGSTFDPNVVLYYDDGAAYDYSAWQLRYVPDEEIQGLLEEAANHQRSEALQKLMEKAQLALRSHATYTSDATADNKYAQPADGLVTSISQVSTNAQEPSYGPLENILDGRSTYFQSNFTNQMTELHHLDFSLGKSVRNVTMKMTRSWKYYPVHVRMYASKDGAQWVSQGEYDLAYTTENDSTTLLNLTLIDDYSHLRVQVTATNSNSKYQGNLYFRLAEVRIYEAQVDYGDYDTEAANTLADLIRVSHEKTVTGKVSEADITALQAALDHFLSFVPDHEGLALLIATYEDIIDHATEGTEVGDYEAGSKTTFSNVVSEVKAAAEREEYKTAAQIEAAKQQLGVAYDTFNAHIVGPQGIFFIKKSDGKYLYVSTPSHNASIRFGGYSTETGDDTNLMGRLNYMWNCHKNDDGTYAFQNVATGRYLTLKEDDATALTFTADDMAPAVGFSLEGAIDHSLYVGHEGYYLTTSSSSLGFTEGEASPLTFTALEDGAWMETHYEDATPGVAAIKTLPFDVMAVIGAYAYRLKGFTHDGAHGTLEFTEVPLNETIPAGTPILFVAQEGISGINFMPAFSDLTQADYSYDEHGIGGMHGTLETRYLKKGLGFLHDGTFYTATDDDYVTAGTGYFVLSEMNECAKGDLSLPLDAKFLVGIAAPTLTSDASPRTIHDLQGRRVRQTKHGVYIIGGKKVVR